MHCLVPDDPDITPTDKLRLDACLECDLDALRAPALSPKVIPAGLYAVTLHRGAWTSLAETYFALIGRWLTTTPHQPAPEPVVETYLEGASTPEPQRRTEVRIRLEERH